MSAGGIDPEGLREWFLSVRDAMVDGDVADLGDLLAEEFELTHMTGYRQSRREWLADVHAGAMRYHSMTTQRLDLGTDGEQPVIDARTVTDATIWGGRGTWNLRLVTTLHCDRGRWLADQMIASMW